MSTVTLDDLCLQTTVTVLTQITKESKSKDPVAAKEQKREWKRLRKVFKRKGRHLFACVPEDVLYFVSRVLLLNNERYPSGRLILFVNAQEVHQVNSIKSVFLTDAIENGVTGFLWINSEHVKVRTY